MTRGIRTVSVFGVAGVLMASAGVSGAEMMRAEVRHEPPSVHGSLTNEQYAAAVRIAQHQVHRVHPRLTSATAIVKRGTVSRTNMSGSCTSGRVIEIRLIGHGFRAVAGGLPGRGGGRVTSMQVTADAVSGHPCLLSVRTGHGSPYHGAADLMPALHR
jgi:hypothetical protein